MAVLVLFGVVLGFAETVTKTVDVDVVRGVSVTGTTVMVPMPLLSYASMTLARDIYTCYSDNNLLYKRISD